MNVSSILGRAPSDIDDVAVSRALGILIEPGATYEIRGLPRGTSRICRTIEEGVLAASSMCGGVGTYYTLNPCREDLDRPAREGDIIARRWILIDVDPVRPPNTNATAAEKDAAQETIYNVLHHLSAGRNWPPPIVIDSGNGHHLLYRCDLGADGTTKSLVKRLLRSLADRFDTDNVKIDTSVYNNARIARLPGTWARKGPHAEDRPHRRCEILWMPSSLEPIGLEQIRGELEYADGSNMLDPSETSGIPATPACPPGPADLARYLRRALESAACAVLLAPAQTAHNTLRAQVYGLAGYLHTGGIDEAEIRRVLKAAANGRNIPDKEADDLIDSGLVKGREAPRPLPVSLAARPKGAVHRNGTVSAAVADDDESPPDPVIVWANSIEPIRVRWLWPYRIARGKLTTFAGPGGIGKTFVLCDIMARVSRGLEWPFSGVKAQKGKCLFISAEDDEDDTLVPRLIECGADLSRIAFLSARSQEHFHLAARDLLANAVESMGGVSLVAIDPPTSYMAGIDDHKNSELRSVLTPLKHWAAKTGAAVIFNTHVNKGSANVDAAARVIGGVAWVNGVRAAHMFAPDEDREGHVLFMPIKINVGRMPQTLVYRIQETRDDLAKIEWIGESGVKANDAVNRERRRPKQKSVSEWLVELFNTYEEVKSDEYWRMAEEHGITRNSIRDFRDREGWPNARKTTGVNGDIFFIWYIKDRSAFDRFAARLEKTTDHRVDA